MTARETWFQRNEEAERLEHQDRLEEALRLYEASAREGCDIPFTFERIAAIHRRFDRHSNAVAALDRAIELEKRRGPSEKLVRLQERRKLTAALAGRHRQGRVPQRSTDDRSAPRRPIQHSQKKGCGMLVVFWLIGGFAAIVAFA